MADLYIAPIPQKPVGPVFPPQRQAQLDETVNEAHRRQRYFVWKLLEYGLRHSLGLSMKQLNLTLNDRGRWSCPECCFSLSHSANAVAVAISKTPIGVDLERLDRTIHPALAKKLLTPSELAALEESEKGPYMLKKWCIRESLFKWQEAAASTQPKEKPCTGTVTVAGQDYCYAVVADEPHRLLQKEDFTWI